MSSNETPPTHTHKGLVLAEAEGIIAQLKLELKQREAELKQAHDTVL